MRDFLAVVSAALLIFWCLSPPGAAYRSCMAREGWFTPGAKYHCTWGSLLQ